MHTPKTIEQWIKDNGYSIWDVGIEEAYNEYLLSL